ncbi:putative lipid II flippase FtsW [Candidatus Uhrbacteria bacterium]|nr:putative lipid II flippase FtsW [Candidatus Uhrbacteria bacterium]
MNPFRKDRALLAGLFVVLVIGIVMLSSASSILGFDKFHDSYYYVKRQLVYGILPGIVLASAVFWLTPTALRRLAMPLYAGSVLLLVLVFIPGIGESLDRARRWIRFGEVLLQPSELAKIASILFAARWLSDQPAQALSDWKRGILPYLGFIALTGGLVILEPDMGTTLVITTTLFSLLFFAGAPIKKLLLVGGIGIIVAMVLVVSSSYRLERLKTFIDGSDDPQGSSYHVNQALVGVSSGGWFGRGLGRSVQKLQYLPEVTSDSLFAIMAEELGFFRIAPVVVLLFWIILRVLRMASRAHDPFSQLACAGIAVWLVVQSSINIGANVGLLPFTGVPLPFLSHGGTSMMVLITSIAIALVLGGARIEGTHGSRGARI